MSADLLLFFCSLAATSAGPGFVCETTKHMRDARNCGKRVSHCIAMRFFLSVSLLVLRSACLRQIRLIRCDVCRLVVSVMCGIFLLCIFERAFKHGRMENMRNTFLAWEHDSIDAQEFVFASMPRLLSLFIHWRHICLASICACKLFLSYLVLSQCEFFVCLRSGILASTTCIKSNMWWIMPSRCLMK